MPSDEDRPLLMILDRAIQSAREEMPGPEYAFAIVLWDRDTGRVVGGMGAAGGASVLEMVQAMETVAVGALTKGPTRRYTSHVRRGKGGADGN
jgi:hypothetical protein